MITADTTAPRVPTQLGEPPLPELKAAFWEAGWQARRQIGLWAFATSLPALIAQATRMAWRADRTGTWMTAVCTLASGLMATAGLLTTQKVLVGVFAGGPTLDRLQAALPALVALGAITAVRAGLGIAAGWAQDGLEPRITQLAERDLFAATTAVDLAAYDDDAFADDLERATGRGPDAAWYLTRAVINALAGFVGVIAVAAALTVIHPLLMIVMLIATVPLAWASLRAGAVRYTEFLAGSVRRRRLNILNQLMAGKHAALELRTYQLRDWLLHQHDTIMGAETRSQLRAARATTATMTVGSLISGLAAVGVYATLGWLLLSGRIPLAAAATAVVGLQTARNALATATMFADVIYTEGRHFADFTHLLSSAQRRARPQPADLAPTPPMRTLHLDDVTLTYPDRDRPAVAGITLTVQAGQTIALVGENGSGKSTLAAIITGLRTPDTGTVSWNDHRLDRLDPADVGTRIAVISQAYWHWPFSAEANIRMGDLSQDGGHPPVEAAARLAAAHDMITRLPHGYQTLLSREFRHGQDLSGGEWQRIAAARGFFRQPELLIMDEPSSALDAKAEAALFDAVQARHATTTTVLISHRLANVRHADVIYVLQAGHLVESGSHDELIASGGLYADLFGLQSESYR